MDATFSSAALAGLEAAINKALSYDPASRQALGQLSGQVLAVTLTKPEVTVYLITEQQSLRLSNHFEGEPDVRVRGSWSALLRLARSDQSNLRNSGVDVSGDTGMLLTLRTIMANLELDWEEALSELLGDVAGHQGAQLLRDAGHWVQGRARSGERLLSEFFTEESRLLPARNELEDFYRAVDDLRLDLDRAEARLRQLETQVRSKQTTQGSTGPQDKDNS